METVYNNFVALLQNYTCGGMYMRKFICVILSIVLLLSVSLSAFAESEKDARSRRKALLNLQKLYED